MFLLLGTFATKKIKRKKTAIFFLFFILFLSFVNIDDPHYDKDKQLNFFFVFFLFKRLFPVHSSIILHNTPSYSITQYIIIPRLYSTTT